MMNLLATSSVEILPHPLEAEAKEAEEALKEMGAQSSMYTTYLITCNESDFQPFCPH